MNFIAIDFETANYFGDSACAVGLVRVENEIITRREYYLIKPRTSWFHFTYIHNIDKEMVKNEGHFNDVWEKVQPMLDDVDFFAAHNAGFDRGVLEACCRSFNLPVPEIPFKCTVELSRKIWKIYPTKLNLVCEHFGIPLDHHYALSDAEACAAIMIRAIKQEKQNALT